MHSFTRHYLGVTLIMTFVVAMAGIDNASAGQRRTLYRCTNCNAESYGEEGLRGFCPGVKRPPGARMADPLHNWQPVEPDRPVVHQPPPPPPPDQRTQFVCSECGRRTFNPTALSEDCRSRMGASRFDRGHKWVGQAPAPGPGDHRDTQRGPDSGRDSGRPPPRAPFRPVAPTPIR